MHERAINTELNKSDFVLDWLKRSQLSPLQNDCVTAIVLKILDAKCRMDMQKQSVIISVYAHTRLHPGRLFHQQVHQTIDLAIRSADAASLKQIHVYRQFAEASIPKPDIKAFKSYLAVTLFVSA